MLKFIIVTCVAIVLLVVFARLFGNAAKPNRVDRFAGSRALELDLHERTVLLRYLAQVRRLRTAGVLAALLGCLAVSLSQDRGLILWYAPLLAGWLAGAVTAELSTRPAYPAPDTAAPDTASPDTPAVAGWMRRFARILALLTVGSTTAALTLTPGDVPVSRVLGWGLAALACAGAVAMGLRAVLARHVSTGVLGPAAERAVRANAIGGITSIGLLAVVACLSGQAMAVHDAADGWQPVPGAVEQAAVVCGIAALMVANLLVYFTRVWPVTEGNAAPARPTSPRIMAGVAAVAVLASAAWVTAAWRTTRAPYQPTAVRPVATIRFTDFDHFTADAAAIGVTGLGGLAVEGRQEFVGRLDINVPSGAANSGTYVLVVIDTRANRMASWLWGPDVPGGGSGWAGAWDMVPERYPWLSAIHSVDLGGGISTDPGMAYMMDPAIGRSVGFEGLLAPGSAVRSPSDLAVALVYFGPDGQLYWATPVPVTAA
ncbi:MAG TPA: hypothetical protein VKB69_14220 [Micromonosporaceae bacterium]|nr:hypothetical protein [Micromonosporaceae bacterium]